MSLERVFWMASAFFGFVALGCLAWMAAQYIDRED